MYKKKFSVKNDCVNTLLHDTKISKKITSINYNYWEDAERKEGDYNTKMAGLTNFNNCKC